MNSDFKYPYWFQKENDDKEFWIFTISGDPEDPNNYNASELEVLLRWAAAGSPHSDWIKSIIGIGICLDGTVDFHFKDGTVSVANAYVGEAYEFLDAVSQFAVGYVISLATQNLKNPCWMPTELSLDFEEVKFNIPTESILKSKEFTTPSQILTEDGGWSIVEISKERNEILEKYRLLDINSPSGTKVTPIYSNGYPANGYPSDQEKVYTRLPEGSIWTVESIDIDNWSSDVYLVELPGIRFNSVSLAHAD